MCKKVWLCFVLVWMCHYAVCYETNLKLPTIVVAVTARNKAHTLPYFLSLLERQNYPKTRISLWIRSDHNVDQTIKVLKTWIRSIEKSYHSVDVAFSENYTHFVDEKGVGHWSDLRFSHIINLRQAALEYARQVWSDYILMIDSDVLLTNPNTLKSLVKKDQVAVAPMLNSIDLYSNFWHGMSDDYYYKRTDEYKKIIRYEMKGCFHVPMIHSCVLVDLRQTISDSLTYLPTKVSNYEGPHDDIITFAISANTSHIPLTVCNENVYGYIPTPLESDHSLEYDHVQMTNLKLEVLGREKPLYVSGLLKQFVKVPEKDSLGFDKIYMINLVRRPDRRWRMLQCFHELGLDVSVVDAVDGRSLNATVLQDIYILPDYQDPYHKRSMTLGEIGCFLSHFKVWQDVLKNGYEKVLVLEDDVRFEPFFRAKVGRMLDELTILQNWDLVYLGRKRLQESDEPWLDGSQMLVKAGYSYWTLGYALAQNGARKLVDAEPLSRLVPVDEYLPILFDRHPQTAWKDYFPKRNLVALSTAPLLLYPTHYTGEEGYVSDTEDSKAVEKFKATRLDL